MSTRSSGISPSSPVEMYQFLHDVSRNPATEHERLLAELCEQLLDRADDLAERPPMSLNGTLSVLGLTTEPGTFGAKTILRNGAPVFAGTADAVWHWLRRAGLLRYPLSCEGAGYYCHHCKEAA